MRAGILLVAALAVLAKAAPAAEPPVTASTIHGNWQGFYVRPKTKPEPMLANFRVDGVEFEGKFYLYPKLPKKKKFPAQEFKLRDGETEAAKGTVKFDRMIAKKKASPCSGEFSHRGLILSGTCQEGKSKARFKLWRTQAQGDGSLVYMDQKNFDFFLKMAQDWDKGIGLPSYFAEPPATAAAPVQAQAAAEPTVEPTPTVVAADPAQPSLAGDWEGQLLYPGEDQQPTAIYWSVQQDGSSFSGDGSDGAHALTLEGGKVNAQGEFTVTRVIDLGVGSPNKRLFRGQLSPDGQSIKGSWVMQDNSTKSLFTMQRSAHP